MAENRRQAKFRIAATVPVERMQDAEGDLPAQDRHADAAQALAQLGIERGRLGIVQRLVGEPFADGAAQNRRSYVLAVHVERPHVHNARTP